MTHTTCKHRPCDCSFMQTRINSLYMHYKEWNKQIMANDDSGQSDSTFSLPVAAVTGEEMGRKGLLKIDGEPLEHKRQANHSKLRPWFYKGSFKWSFKNKNRIFLCLILCILSSNSDSLWFQIIYMAFIQPNAKNVVVPVAGSAVAIAGPSRCFYKSKKKYFI